MAEPVNAIGIHIDGKMLRRVQAVRRGAAVYMQRLDSQPLPAADRTAHSGIPARPATASVKVIAALSGADVMTRYWTMPAGDAHKLRQIVANRLEAESPLPIEELAWAYRVGPLSVGQPSRPVLVQAARNTSIAQHLAALAAVESTPDVLTTETEGLSALVRYGLTARQGGSELIVLAGNAEWIAGVLIDGLVRGVKRMRVDHPALDSAEIGTNRLELTCREIRQFVESELGDDSPRRIRWSGTDVTSGCGQLLSDWLHAPVEPVEIAPGVTKSDGTPITADDLATFGPALGLALAAVFADKELIHLAGSWYESVPLGRFEQLLAYPWRWTAAALTLAVLALVIHISVLRHQTRTMQDTLRQVNTPMSNLDPKVRTMQRLESYRIDIEGIVAELSRTIPPSVVVSSMQISRERRLVIKATSGDPKAIYTWAEALRKNERFSTVNPERIAPGQAPGQGGEFTITADLTGVQKLTTVSGRGAAWH